MDVELLVIHYFMFQNNVKGKEHTLQCNALCN